MQKHIEDDGDLHILINDDGQMLVACARCHRAWTGALGPTRKADAGTVAGLVKTLFEHQKLAEAAGIELDLLLA